MSPPDSVTVEGCSRAQVGLPGTRCGPARPGPGCSHATVNVVAVSEPSFARAAGHDLIGDLQRAMDDQGVGWAWTQHAAGWLRGWWRGEQAQNRDDRWT